MASEDSIEVFARKESNGDMTIKIVCWAGTRVETIRNTLNATDKYPEWVYRCDSAYTLDATPDGSFTFVSKVDMPFPFRDREVVARVKQNIDANGILVRTIRSTPDRIPPNKGILRQQVYTSTWRAEPQPDERVKLTCTVRTDAGSGLPGWIRREIMASGPLRTIRKLRSRLNARK